MLVPHEWLNDYITVDIICIIKCKNTRMCTRIFEVNGKHSLNFDLDLTFILVWKESLTSAKTNQKKFIIDFCTLVFFWFRAVEHLFKKSYFEWHTLQKFT